MLRSPVIYLSLLAVLLLPNCGQEEKAKSTAAGDVPVDEYKDPAFEVFSDPSGKAYFPEGKASWYTRHLNFVREPSLQAELPEGTTFVLRFTLLFSFTDNFMVRIYDSNGTIHARAVREEKDHNYNPVKLAEDRAVDLSGELPEQIRTWLASSEFWRPLSENEEGLAGFDGSRWIFELRDITGYRMLDLWTPDSERASDEILKKAGFDPGQIRDFGPYVKLGNQLLKLVHLQTETAPE